MCSGDDGQPLRLQGRRGETQFNSCSKAVTACPSTRALAGVAPHAVATKLILFPRCSSGVETPAQGRTHVNGATGGGKKKKKDVDLVGLTGSKAPIVTTG